MRFSFARKDEDSTWVSGKELADAFASSIGKQAATKFLDAIRNESISKATLDELKGVFRPDVIPQHSTEHELLSRLICQSDDPLHSNHEEGPRLRARTIELYIAKFEETQHASVEFWKEPYRRFTALAYLEGPESQNSAAGLAGIITCSTSYGNSHAEHFFLPCCARWRRNGGAWLVRTRGSRSWPPKSSRAKGFT